MWEALTIALCVVGFSVSVGVLIVEIPAMIRQEWLDPHHH